MPMAIRPRHVRLRRKGGPCKLVIWVITQIIAFLAEVELLCVVVTRVLNRLTKAVVAATALRKSLGEFRK